MLLSVLAFACKISAVALIQNHNDKPQQCVQLSSNYSLMKRGTACSKSLAWFIPPPPILPPEKAFEFRVDCNALGSINCSSAHEAFKGIGIRIANQILIRRPIVVNVTAHKFNDTNALAKGTVVSWRAASRCHGDNCEDGILMYPQALLKQAELFEISWKSGSIDIEISINSEHEWLSGPDALRTPNKPALEYMVAHELTHGMGFSSLLVEYTSGDVSYLAPQIFNLENKRTSGRIPVSVFDGLLPIPKFFHDTSLVPTEKDKFVETLEANDDLMLSVNDFYALVTSDSLYATVSGDRIRLHSPTNYKKGVSITHLHLSFADTSDFLMVSGTQSTTSMAQFYNDGPIYGPNTLKIFKGLGYATKNDPTVIKLLNI